MGLATYEYKFSPSGPEQGASRGPGCELFVRATLPQEGYTEIGTLAVIVRGTGGWTTKDLDEFKTIVGPTVCEAGGEVIMYEKNGYGQFIGGVVFAKRGIIPRQVN
jgi:hypothetical protein